MESTGSASFCVFGISRGFTRRSELRVELPAAWAREHADVVVALGDAGGELGWHACVAGDEGAILLTFPWYDHADRILRGERPAEQFPTTAPDEEWSDLEQGWFGWASGDGGFVYLAEGDFDQILAVRNARTLERIRPGVVAVEGVEVSWNRVPREAYERAWADAIASCRAGAPFPVGVWTAAADARVDFSD